MTSSKKWRELIGCSGYFDKSGYFIIHPNLKAHTLDFTNSGTLFMVLGEQDKKHIGLTLNGFSVIRLEKKYVKIHKVPKK